MENRPARAASHEEACARVAVGYGPRWLQHYARAKLRSDPVFRAAYDLLGGTNLPLLDLGCGVGLLPMYLRARGFAPLVTGLEIDARKIAHAQATECKNASFQQRDLRADLPEFQGSIALFDVLHYLPRSRQESLLRELVERLAPGGMLLIRDSPSDGSLRFCTTYVGELFAQAISWNIGVRLNFPSREMINRACPNAEERPMYGTGPFNNRLFIFRKKLQALS